MERKEGRKGKERREREKGKRMKRTEGIGKGTESQDDVRRGGAAESGHGLSLKVTNNHIETSKQKL